MISTKIRKAAGGRPPKFKETRHPITVTLPDRILKSLERIGPDRALALVKCVETVIGAQGEVNPVELIEVLPGKALIVVSSRKALSQIEWLRLVEIAPARYLLVFPTGKPIECLEVELKDLGESLAVEDDEHRLIEQLQKVLVQQRRQKTLTKGELLVVDVSR